MDKGPSAQSRIPNYVPEETGRWRIAAHTKVATTPREWHVGGCGYRDRYDRDPQPVRMLETLYYFKANERTRDAVFWVAKALERLLSEQKYEPCREFLRLVSKRLDAVPADSLGSILTATYVAKGKLGTERADLYKAVSEFYSRQLGSDKAARALFGLA